MNKSKLTVGGVIAAAIGWFFFNNFEITKDFQIRGKSPTAATSAARSELPPLADGESIRIATFNIQVLGDAKVAKADVLVKLGQICGQFDVVAIQELRAQDGQAVIDKLVDAIQRTTGRSMASVIGPRLGDTSSKEQYVFLYDRSSILCDAEQAYTVQDPDRLLHRPPFVALFRARKPPAEQAFTFILANIHTDPDHAEEETSAMELVLDAVLNDGRREDDVLLLGDFNTSNKKKGRLNEVRGLADVIDNEATTPNYKKQYDHIFFLNFATTEFYRGGVFDTVREFNLTLEQAELISDHLPVWGEFSIYEGGPVPAIAKGMVESSSR